MAEIIKNKHSSFLSTLKKIHSRKKFLLGASLTVVFAFAITAHNAFAADSITKKAHGGHFYPPYPEIQRKPGVDYEMAKRGEYLVKMGDCISCHTNTPAGGKPFAGGLPLDTPFGRFFAPNITPDKETGIGNWTDEDFIRAMHEGKNPKGENYFPVFPYPSFTKVSKQDILAIKAYLDSIPAVKQKDKPPTAPWPFSWRFGVNFWNFMYFDKGYYKYDPSRSKEWNRGAYIVQGLGHCGGCHTPRNFMGAEENKHFLTGGFIEGYWAPDITELEFEGIPKKEIVSVFDKRELINKAGPVRGPMDEVDHNSLQYMSKEDLEAIATYLKTVNSEQPRLADGVKQKPAKTNWVGKKVYDNVCAICHDKGVAGAPMIYDTYNWTRRLDASGLQGLYKHAINGYNNMPPRGACVTCTDADVKAAVDYILRNSQTPFEKNIAQADKSPKPDTSIAFGKKIYQQHCAVCHDSGHLGAQKLGDKQAWQPLLQKGMDALFKNTIHGVGAMPAKGGCKDCSDSDILAAIKYMAQEANPEGNYSLW